MIRLAFVSSSDIQVNKTQCIAHLTVHWQSTSNMYKYMYNIKPLSTDISFHIFACNYAESSHSSFFPFKNAMVKLYLPYRNNFPIKFE